MAALGDSLVDNPVGPGLTLEQSSSESKEDDDDDAELELVADEEHLRRLGALLSNAQGEASAGDAPNDFESELETSSAKRRKP